MEQLDSKTYEEIKSALKEAGGLLDACPQTLAFDFLRDSVKESQTELMLVGRDHGFEPKPPILGENSRKVPRVKKEKPQPAKASASKPVAKQRRNRVVALKNGQPCKESELCMTGGSYELL